MGRASPSQPLIMALSELAANVQRRRSTDDVLQTAGEGVRVLGMRLVAFQIVGEELVLRYVATAPSRRQAIEGTLGRALHGLRAPLARLDLAREAVSQRATIHRQDLDVLHQFLQVATGFDSTPLDARRETAGVTNGVIAPLYASDEPWGLLLVASPALTPGDAAAVRLFATQVASSLEAADHIEALERAQRQLVNRERLAALGELSATVAHEVRNPLSVIYNAIGSLRRLLPDRADEVETLLSIMGEEAGRLDHIVSDLLDFARPTSPAKTRSSLRKVVEEALAVASEDPRAAGVDVRVALPDDLPCLEMDNRHISQVLINVVTNAFQAMQHSGVLTVRGRIERGNGRALARVDVSDTGPGIAPEDVPRIFEPFFTTKPTGTGLGLAVAKRVIEAHGGDIDVGSSERGTTVTLRLPLEQDLPAASAAVAQGR